MSNEELIRAYAVSIMIITFLDEYSQLERTGVLAKVYNKITKKNSVFNKQIQDFKLKKRLKISHKANLFLFAQSCAIRAWSKGIKESTKETISVGTTVANLFRLNNEYISKIYGLNEAEFIKINKLSRAGVTLPSCRMARILTDHIVLTIKEQIHDAKK